MKLFSFRPRTVQALALAVSTLSALSLSALSSPTEFKAFTIGKNGFVFEKLNEMENWDNYRMQIASRLDQEIDIIDSIHSALEARGTKLVIALVPMIHRIYAAQLPDRFKQPVMLSGMYGAMIQNLNRFGVLTPNIEHAYLEYAKRDQLKNPLFMRADHHWSPSGGLEAARVVANAVQKRYGPLLASMPEIKYDMKLRAARTYPQHASYHRVLNPTERKQIKLDSIRVPEFTQHIDPHADSTKTLGNDLGLLTDTTPEISVVGSSFSAIAEFGFAASIGHRLSRDVLNVAQAGKEAWLPLGEYIASETFQNHPPKILIWEIPEAFLLIGMKPVNNTDSWSSRQFLLELGANLKGDCGGTAPLASFGPDFVIQGANASSNATRAGSFIKYQFAKPIKPDQYLSLRASSNQSDSFMVEGEGIKAPRYYSKLPGYGKAFRVNVPLSTLANGKTQSLKIRVSPGSDLKIESPKLCTLPAKLAVLAGAGY
jgi:alginate O-acetyltransferase complex protein AlgJ